MYVMQGRINLLHVKVLVFQVPHHHSNIILVQLCFGVCMFGASCWLEF
ncbi:hypothetical protein HanRHA438_Chr09g0381491 [Helianthus annuus]|nr:hypothetical protein HanIR_Chr09g0399131 [Helianthus annuus]KAJ0886612.1 hypothetical protein HanRHA438_Chr09g0381491 [Helianthus annuus]